MPFTYTQADLQAEMNRGIQNRQGLLSNVQQTLNASVREVLSEIRIRSTRRKVLLVPNMLNGVFEYVCPSDLQASDIIDIPAQAKRYDGEFTLVPSEQFARRPRKGDIAIDDFNGIRVLRIDSNTPDSSVTIDPLGVEDSGSGNIWNAFGGADDVATDSDQYVVGSSSVSFDIDATIATTAGLYKDALPTTDLSEFILHNALFVSYARLTSATNVTNLKLRLGSSASDYYEFTVTARLDGTAFSDGQNPIAFNALSPTTAGAPDAADITYVALFMTKTTGKVSENGYAFNLLQARKGQYADVKYYSNCGWQTSAGAYIANSTSATDILVAEQDEFDLFAKRAIMKATQEADLGGNAFVMAKKEYLEAKANYELKNPSEDKTNISSYHEYDNCDDQSLGYVL